MSKKMFSRERERGKLRFSALLILIGLLLFGCDPTTVTITYNANGGEGEMKPQAVESGVEVKLIANTFTKDGSDFTGWNEAADGSGKAYADGATVTPTGNLTLYAQWQVKSAPENPGTEDPGTEDPVDRENHITNLVLIKAVEDTYRQSSGSEFGWTKTAEGYVDMTDETNKTLVEGVTSLAPNGDMYLDGIEYFTGLQNLTLLNNSVLTELPDLTNFNNLQILSVISCGLTAVSGLPASLEILDLNTNKLTALDVSDLTNLSYLDVSDNELTELDVTLVEAFSANHLAQHEQHNLICYQDMGLYQLILPQLRSKSFQNYIRFTRETLLEYDKKYNSHLLRTLRTYIACQGKLREEENLDVFTDGFFNQLPDFVGVFLDIRDMGLKECGCDFVESIT